MIGSFGPVTQLVNLEKIIGKRTIEEILLLCRLTNHMISTKQTQYILDILKNAHIYQLIVLYHPEWHKQFEMQVGNKNMKKFIKLIITEVIIVMKRIIKK